MKEAKKEAQAFGKQNNQSVWEHAKKISVNELTPASERDKVFDPKEAKQRVNSKGIFGWCGNRLI